MEVLDRLDQELTAALRAKGWKCRGGRRFVGDTHCVELLPPGRDDRVTVFYGRCVEAGDPSRLAYVSRITFTSRAELEAFVSRL